MYFPIIDVLKENFIAKIPSIVTQWLTDNVDPVGSAVVVDESLSISGAAADAKVTGDEISNLKSDLMTLSETASVTSTGVGDYFVYYPISAGDRIKAVSTIGVNIHTRATKTGANIEELGYVNAAGSPKIFTATADASWFKMYFTGAGTITFENLNKRVPVLEESISDLENNFKVFNVGATREYTQLRDGIAEAIKYKNSIVYVDAGTYDLCEEFASEITANQAGVRFGIGLGNGVHVVFEAGAKVVADYTGGVQNITSYFYPFYPTDDGCFTLENADIDVKNTRYCVHDEWSGHTNPRTVKYINCKMQMDNTSAVINWYPQCIGGGNGASDYISIENCYFKSKVAESAIVPLVSYHNNNSGTGDMMSDVHMSNCYLADKGTFRCTYSGQATAVSSAYVNNCSLGANPIIGQEQSGGTAPENYELITWMNEVRQ